MIRKEKPLVSIAEEIMKGKPVQDMPRKYKPKPGTIPPQRPIKPGKPGTPKPTPKPIDFGKVLGQQPISMGEGYKDEINKIRPMGNGSAMNKQYRAQGGGRFK